MRRLLYDLNVVLDVLLRREPHFAASAKALDAVGRGEVEGFLAGHCVTTLFYVLRRQVGSRRAHTLTAELLTRLRVAPVTDAGIRSALGTGFGDFEDAVCHAAAAEIGAEAIVTRNVADFRGGSIPALLPEIFVQAP